MQGKQDQNNDSVRPIYVAPQLNEFGRVRDLTAGGSKGNNEFQAGNSKNRP